MGIVDDAVEDGVGLAEHGGMPPVSERLPTIVRVR